MKPWLVWTIGVALVVAAWAVVQVTPDDDAAVAPFVVSAAVGEKAVGRTFEITVTDARLGLHAVADGWSADGTWLVVDLEAAAHGEERGATLSQAELVVDGVRYRASERPDSLFRTGFAPGLPREGSIAFELPEHATGGTGMLQLGFRVETRLDSLLEVPVDLRSLPQEAEVELMPSGWAKP